jgi:uncharacterized repeat protein (TIGR01451 family)
MSYRRHWFALLLPVLLIVMMGAGVVGAQDEPARTDSVASGLTGAEAIAADVVADSFYVENNTVRMADGRLRVIVELRAEPAAVAFARAGAEGGGAAAEAVAEAQRTAVQAEQSAFLSAAAAAGINAEVFAQYDTVGNGLSLGVTPEQLNALRALPQVAAIHPVFRVERATSTSIPHVGAPSAWNGSLGGPYTGAGIVISIIDSGVDFTHTNNGGSGVWPTNPADRVVLPGGVFPPGNKVIGGFDYVGDFFNGGVPGNSGLAPNETASPDPNPLDCSIRRADMLPTFGFIPGEDPVGHGTHVAGIAAGFGVNADGSTYTGGYAAVPFASLRIGPGAAPEASILAMRVFGCYGSAFSDIIAASIDDSVSGRYGARADVINMSLGSGFGYGGNDNRLNSFYGGAIANAMLAGTLVVASAGNQQDTFFVTGSPGSTPAALNVASTADGGEGGILINGNPRPARPGIVNGLLDTPARPFVYLSGNGCTAAQYATFPANTIAVVNWTGSCGSIGLMTAATDANLAGGNRPIAILVANNVPSAFQNLTCSYGGSQVSPPFVGCASIQQATGQFLAANPTALITLDDNLLVFATDLADTISTFSSRGPGRYATDGLKPEIAAPGDSITSTGAGLGNGPQTLGGTSMAAPTVAGAAALLMQANPSWPAHQIKAALINTANNNVFLGSTSGPRVGPQRAGSGRLDIEDMLSNRVVAYNDYNPVVASVHFGFPWVVPTTSYTESRPVRFVNRGATPATYNLSIDTFSNANIASFSVSPTTITVPAFGTVVVNVTLTVTVPNGGTQTANRSDPSMAANQATTAGTFVRNYLTEESANLIATPTSGATVPLRVPLYAAPRSGSSMRSLVNPYPFSGSGFSSFQLMPLAGQGVFDAASGFPQNVVSSVTAMQYAGSDNVGDTAYPLPSHDIQYVGVSSNYMTSTPSINTRLNFGVAMAGDWATPNEYFIVVYVDMNKDGFTGGPDDWEVYTTAPNISGTTSRSDAFLSVACPSAPGSSCFFHDFVNQLSPGFNTYVLNNNVMVIPVFPFALRNYRGTGNIPLMNMNGNLSFNFYVETFNRALGETVDVSPVMTYDMRAPMFDATLLGSTTGIWDDTNGNNIPFTANFAGRPVNLTQTGSTPAALLLHHHNVPNVTATNGQNFRRAEVVYFDVDQTDIVVDKFSSLGTAKALPGQEFTWFVTVSNPSSGVAAAVRTVDTLPAGVTFIGASPGCTHSGQPIGGTVTCNTLINPLQSVTYYIDVRIDPTFVGALTNTVTANSDILEVNPTNNTDTDTVLVTPPAPILIAPNGDILDNTPDFQWYDINGAGWYFLRVMEGSSEVFSGWFEKVSVCSGGVCTVSPITVGPGAFEFMVYAWNEVSGAGPWSAPMSFRNISKPGVPTPIAPIGNITSTDPDFVWTSVLGATHYHFWLSRTEGPGAGYVHDLYMSASGICSGGTCTYNAPVTLTPGRYTWWVQAHSPISGAGMWTSGTQFTVNATPATPTPIAPIGAITSTTPTFVFSDVPGGMWYYLWLSSGPNKILDQWYDGGIICNGTTCEVTPGVVLPPGEYVWFIQTWTPFGGYSAWSSGTSFTVALAPLPPVQVSPVGSILQTNPTYVWERASGATWYYVWVSGPSGYVLDRWYEASAVCTGMVCSAMPNVVLGSGVHRWWVQAWNPWGGYSPWSGPQVFNVGGPGGLGDQDSAPIIAPIDAAPVDAGMIEVLPEPGE